MISLDLSAAIFTSMDSLVFDAACTEDWNYGEPVAHGEHYVLAQSGVINLATYTQIPVTLGNVLSANYFQESFYAHTVQDSR